MPRWLSLLYGLAAVVGSVVGLAPLVLLLLQGSRFGFPGELVLSLALALYSIGIWSGVQAIRLRDGWTRLARWFWLAQVPMLSSSTVSFSVSCAAGVWIYLRQGSSRIGAGVSAHLGTGLQWSYGQPRAELLIGVNILALLAALLLFKRWGHEEEEALPFPPTEAPDEAA